MHGSTQNDVTVRAFADRDREAVLALAERLTIGMPAWRDSKGCLAAVRGWVEASIERSAEAGTLLVAVDGRDRMQGFVAVKAATHFSGEHEAYIGELVVDECCEGRGVGRALVIAAEDWALLRGYRTLTLETGAANRGARGFYERLGFIEEEIRLTKILKAA